MTNRTTARTSLAALLAGVLALGACGSDAASTASTSTTVVASDATGDASAGSDDGAAGIVQQVDANTASIEELAAAFEANGIPSASRWAHEVDEYRPYDTGDTSLAKLRQELSKYNPSDDVLEAIVGSLTL